MTTSWLYRIRVTFDLAASAIAVLFAIGVAGLSAYWLVFTAGSPVVSLGGDYAVNPKVQPGGELLVARNYCVTKPPVCTVGRRITNAKEQYLPSIETPTELGCFKDKITAVEIPGTTESGFHVYRATVRCNVNPAITTTVKMPDIKFEVVYDLPRKPAAKR